MSDKNVVTLYEGKELRVKTWDLWQGFGYSEHRALKKIIWENKSDFEEFGKLITSTGKDTNQKGRPDESYLLNENQFVMLIAMVKNTPEAKKLKKSLVIEFSRMKRALADLTKAKAEADWLQVRKDGKMVYHHKTNVIKHFVEYAESQGSKSANKYYTALAKMENQALFMFEMRYPNLREVMNIKQLMQVSVADQIIEKAIFDGMEDKLHYKKVFELAKERVIQLSNIIGKSQILAMQEANGQLTFM